MGMIKLTIFFFFFTLTNSQRRHDSFSFFNPDIPLVNYGFTQNGEYDISLSSSYSGKIYAFLASSSEVKRFPDSLFTVCTTEQSSRPIQISKHNISIDYIANKTHPNIYTWSGIVDEDSVYFLYIINCNNNRSIYTTDCQFSNPESYLDTRDEILLHLYLIYSFIYAFIALIWLGNAIVYSRFRVPLHTCFLLLPPIRCVVLMVTSSFWGDLRMYDIENIYKQYLMFFLNFIYYTLMFIAISLALAGYCIFRQKFSWTEKLEIVFSSVSLGIAILLVQYISDIQQAFLIMAGLVFSLIWFLKQNIISLLIVNKLVRQMKEPQVVAKVKLSQKFATYSFLMTIFTLILSVVAVVTNAQKSVIMSLLEIGLIANSLLQLKSFLLRKQNCADELAQDEMKILFVKPKTLASPNGSELVLFVQEIVIN